MKRHSDKWVKILLICAGGLAALAAAAVLIMRQPAKAGNSEADTVDFAAAETSEGLTAGEVSAAAEDPAESGMAKPAGEPAGTVSGGEEGTAGETMETAETEIVVVVDIYEKAVEVLKEEASKEAEQGDIAEVIAEDKIVIEAFEDSDDDSTVTSGGGSGGTSTKAAGETGSTEAAKESESRKDTQKEPETKSTAESKESESKKDSQKEPETKSTAESKESESKKDSQKESESGTTAASGEPEGKEDSQKEPETEPSGASQEEESLTEETPETAGSTESTETETETETTAPPVIQRKALVFGDEEIIVPVDAPESIRDFDALPGESKYNLAKQFDSVAQYNEYLALLQEAADQARIDVGEDAGID